jgi:hypothetical protein
LAASIERGGRSGVRVGVGVGVGTELTASVVGTCQAAAASRRQDTTMMLTTLATTRMDSSPKSRTRIQLPDEAAIPAHPGTVVVGLFCSLSQSHQSCKTLSLLCHRCDRIPINWSAEQHGHSRGRRPADFATFWEGVLTEADALPLAPSFELVDWRSTPAVDVFDVRFTSLGGLHIAA